MYIPPDPLVGMHTACINCPPPLMKNPGTMRVYVTCQSLPMTCVGFCYVKHNTVFSVLTCFGVLFLHIKVSYMISAWARMCKIIGSGFVQYLPVVMGPLIQAASLKPEIAFFDGKHIY